jgi:hypothetical protein
MVAQHTPRGFFLLKRRRKMPPNCTCRHCLCGFWKPAYDPSDSERCRRCTMFLNAEAAWRSRMTFSVPNPAENRRSAFFGA